jgi:DNA-directed RNA polymerase III subunit RPC4
MSLLGEVNKRFVVSPDIDALLAGMEAAEQPRTLGTDGAETMDTT